MFDDDGYFGRFEIKPKRKGITPILQWLCLFVLVVGARWWIIDNLGVPIMFTLAMAVGIAGIVVARDTAEAYRDDDEGPDDPMLKPLF